MSTTRFSLCAAAVSLAAGLCGTDHAGAAPLSIPLPLQAVPAPPTVPSPLLLGVWQDKQCLLLPPGISPFEAVSDAITLRQDGTFTQAINKATGRLKETGTFTVAGTHLTLRYLVGTGTPAAYEFSRKGETLFLQRTGSGKPACALDRGRP